MPSSPLLVQHFSSLLYFSTSHDMVIPFRPWCAPCSRLNWINHFAWWLPCPWDCVHVTWDSPFIPPHLAVFPLRKSLQNRVWAIMPLCTAHLTLRWAPGLVAQHKGICDHTLGGCMGLHVLRAQGHVPLPSGGMCTVRYFQECWGTPGFLQSCPQCPGTAGVLQTHGQCVAAALWSGVAMALRVVKIRLWRWVKIPLGYGCKCWVPAGIFYPSRLQHISGFLFVPGLKTHYES